MNHPDKSFQFNSQDPSFRVKGFKWTDGVLLVIAFILVTFLGFAFGWIPSNFLPEKAKLILSGFFLGCSFCLLLSKWFLKSRFNSKASVAQNSSVQTLSANDNANQNGYGTELSPEVQQVAREPKQLIAAIKLYRQQHPSAGLAEAKQRIERFQQQGF